MVNLDLIDKKNGESSVKDLSPFYEDIISDLKELMKRVIEYDDVIIHLRPLIAGESIRRGLLKLWWFRQNRGSTWRNYKSMR